VEKSHLALVAPTTVIGTVANRPRPPRRQRNAESRAREYLTDGEVARLINTARRNRHGHRDATMVLVARCAIPSWRRPASSISGVIDRSR
jgi:hypothetical protein